MDARKMKKPLEGERSFSNTPVHIIALNFRRSLPSDHPRPVTRHYFSPNPLFRPPVLAPNFRHSVSPNPLFRPPHHFMDLVNNQTRDKNRVRRMFKEEMEQAENPTTALSIPARGGGGDSDRAVENTTGTGSTSGVKLVIDYIWRGENMVKLFLSISHEISHPVMIVSAAGIISSVKLLGTTGLISYEGRFEIKQLHGSIDRVTGAINLLVEFIMNDSSVISGIVMGPLIAASRIEVRYFPLVQYPFNIPNFPLDDGESEDGESGDDENEDDESGVGETEYGESGDDESGAGETENGESGDDASENGEDN